MIRILDILISFVAIVILFPFLLPIVILLKLTGEHDIFYLQTRVGYKGKDFKVFKFATMLRDSPNMPGGVLTQKNDPRILPLGNFLRKTKINELPQLINILIGDMSFVGPRPQARRHYELYSDYIRSRIDTVRPGLTGIGSVIFRDEESILNDIDSDRDKFHDTVIAPYKGILEDWYVENKSVRLYLQVIFLTAVSVIIPRSKLHFAILKELPDIPEELMGFL